MAMQVQGKTGCLSLCWPNVIEIVVISNDPKPFLGYVEIRANNPPYLTSDVYSAGAHRTRIEAATAAQALAECLEVIMDPTVNETPVPLSQTIEYHDVGVEAEEAFMNKSAESWSGSI